MPGGHVLRVDGKDETLTEPSVIAFVDREPAANWGHDSRYLVLDARTGAATSFEAQFPPFMRGAPETLRLAWKGDQAPDWALAVQEAVSD